MQFAIQFAIRMAFAIQFAMAIRTCIQMAIRMTGRVDSPSGWRVGSRATIRMAIPDDEAKRHPFWPSRMTIARLFFMIIIRVGHPGLRKFRPPRMRKIPPSSGAEALLFYYFFRRDVRG